MAQFFSGVCWLLVWCPGFVVCWVFRVCLVCVVCVWLFFCFCLCWFWCVLVGPLFCGCVALSAFLLLVCFAPPVRCTVLVLVAPGSCVALLVLLVVVGLVVLLLRCFMDPAPGGSGSWFNAECHPGWVAVWCFCSWWLWEFVSVCGHVVNVVLEFVDSVWCVSGSAFYSLESSVWSSFLSCCCFCSLLASVSWAVLRFSLDPPGSCCFCLFVSSCCFCRCCCVSC